MSKYIGVIPGKLRGMGESHTDLLKVLGVTGLEPMDIGTHNDGYDDPPVAAIEIDGKQYSLVEILKTAASGGAAMFLHLFEESVTGYTAADDGVIDAIKGYYEAGVVPKALLVSYVGDELLTEEEYKDVTGEDFPDD